VRVNIDQKFQEVLASWNGMLRVVELTIPFAYQHVVNVVMFVFVYSAPFLYVTPSKGWSISDTSLLAS
jgi:predicted membrane chloride channel (bestrophin family)